MNRIARGVFSPSARLAYRASPFRPAVPCHVIMSDAATRPLPEPKSMPVVEKRVDWDKLGEFAKSAGLKRAFAQIQADSGSLAVEERPSGSVDYHAKLPRGGMRSVDWQALSEVVSSEEGRKLLSELRGSIEEMQDWIRQWQTPADPIDWRYYHAQLDPVVPGFVDQCQKSLDEVIANTPDIDLSKFMKEAEEVSKSAHQAVEEYCKGIQEVKALIDADLANLKTERSVPDMTTEEVMALYPELAAEIEKEIAEGNWNI